MAKIKLALLLVSMLLFTGCISYQSTIPENYKGEKAYILDSANIHSSSKADMFYLEKIDNKEIYNSRYSTLDKNHGRGFYMIVDELNHDIPAKKAKFTIVGRTHFAAPILALTNDVYEVRGTIEFVPEKDSQYIVKGLLGKEKSLVWIENYKTKEVIIKKIEKKDSSLGFFEK